MSSQMSVINLKDALPSYLGFLFSLHPPALSLFQLELLLVGLTTLCVTIILIYKYFQWKHQLSQKHVLLEIKPPSIALQSAFSTKQLFTILYSLDRDTPFIERILNVKQTISYEIVSTREDGIRYIFSIPEEEVPILKKNVLSYLPGTIIKEIADYLPHSAQDLHNKQFSLYELKLGKSYVLPLQEQDILNQHDPIAYITGQMTKQDPHELIAIQFVTTPVTGRFHSHIKEHIYMLNKRIYAGKEIVSHIQADNMTGTLKIGKTLSMVAFNIVFSIAKSLGDWIMDFAMASENKSYREVRIYDSMPKETIKELSSKQKYVQDMVEGKINQNLFETTIRLLVIGSMKDNVTLRRKGITSSFSTFNHPGYQTVKPKNTLPFSHKLVTKFNYIKLKYRLLSSASPILSVSELSSLYHFPYTTTTHTEDIQSVKSTQLPAPMSLKNANGSLDMVFATNVHGEALTPIGLTLEERRRHMYIIGATGMGKSTMLLHMIRQDIQNGKGLAVIDPHGELAKTVLHTIPPERVKDVVYINPYDTKYPIALNLLELPKGLDETELQREKDLIVSSFLSIMHKLYLDKYVGPRMEHILRNTILTALELENPTIETIHKLLTNENFRREARKQIKDKMLKSFWRDEFEKQSVKQKTDSVLPITNKLGRFLTTMLTRNIVNQPTSTVDFEDVINSKKILICNLSKGEIGEDITTFLGSLIIAKLQLAALRRIHMTQEERVDFFMYIDEFQNFATSSFAQILSEARKYRLNAILAHQNITQIKDDDLIDTILANSGTVVSFRTASPNDEKILLPFFAPQVYENQIKSLPSYMFYMKINALLPQDVFTGQIERFTVDEKESTYDEVVTYTQKIYGSPVPSMKRTSKKIMKEDIIEADTNPDDIQISTQEWLDKKALQTT